MQPSLALPIGDVVLPGIVVLILIILLVVLLLRR
jgi:hypothetical protein